jgi:hypothetical protein
MTIKERLNSLIDRLPDGDAERLEVELRQIDEAINPVWRAFMDAPEDDESQPGEKIKAIEEAHRVYMIEYGKKCKTPSIPTSLPSSPIPITHLR